MIQLTINKTSTVKEFDTYKELANFCYINGIISTEPKTGNPQMYLINVIKDGTIKVIDTSNSSSINNVVPKDDGIITVSYTHLTLPTTR
jgi:hypothetical protein